MYQAIISLFAYLIRIFMIKLFTDTCDSTKYVCQVLYHCKKGINHWTVSLAFIPKEKLNVSKSTVLCTLIIQLSSQRDQPLHENADIGPSSEFQFIKGSNIINLEFRETAGWNVTVYSDSQQVCCVIKVVA